MVSRTRSILAVGTALGGLALLAAGPAAARPADEPAPAAESAESADSTGSVTEFVAAGRAEARELVQNGNFESPQSPKAGLIGNFPRIPGWTETTGHGLEIQNGLAPRASGGGDQYVELDSKGPSSIYQDIETIPGRTYRLVFKYAAHPGMPAAESAFEVTFGDATQSIAPAPRTTTAWRTADMDVVATGTTSRLTFADGAGDGRVRGLGVFIDLVSVSEVG